MTVLRELWAFWVANAGALGRQTGQHLLLTTAALAAAVAVGGPLGVWLVRHPRWQPLVLGAAGVLQTVPSIALLGFLIPWLGIGATPALVALGLYALLPIVRNTVAGLEGVPPAVVEAARGLGYARGQLLRRVQLPLALPVLLAGVRTAAVINVGVTTLAAYVAAGGLGEFIFQGISLNNPVMILAGAVPAAGLALAFDLGLGTLVRLAAAGGVARSVARTFSPRVLTAALAALLLAAGYGAARWGGWLGAGGGTRKLQVRATDRATAPPLTAGFSPEFVGRADCWPGLTRAYPGLGQLRYGVLAPALVYDALRDGRVDVCDGYSTDGRIRAYGLRVLRDDAYALPPYYAAPLLRTSLLAAHPELAPVLGQLAGRLPDSTMTRLNYEVELLHRPARAVALRWLRGQGLYRAPRPLPAGAPVVRLGAKIFAEQYVLVALYEALIRGGTDLAVETRLGLGGTTICFEALRQGAIDLYPEYTGTGLQVLLQPAPRVLDSLGGRPAAVYAYVQRECQRRYGLTWGRPLGFNNTYCLLVREQQGRQLGLGTIADLGRRAGRQ